MSARGAGDFSARCLSLLGEMKELIEGSSTDTTQNSAATGEGAVQHPQRSTSSTSSELSARPASVPRGGERTGNVMQNLRSLFAPYQCSAGPSSSTRNQSRPPPAKKPKSGFFQVKETWTHEFFCLASKTAISVPNKLEKLKMQNAGLGRRKVVMNCRGTAVDVKKDLERVFHKLKESGGFELLRSGVPATSLSLLSPPAGGYSVPYLRDGAGLGQALVYIRPLQNDLDMGATAVENTDQVCVVDAPTVQCILCHTQVPMPLFRQHQAQCGADKKCEALTTHPERRTIPCNNSLGLAKDDLLDTSSEDEGEGATGVGAKVSAAGLKQTLESNSLNLHDESAGSSGHEGQSNFERLQEMFPGQTRESIQEALSLGKDLSETIEHLLTEASRDDDESIYWKMPLSTTMMREVDYRQALKKFITSAVNTHLPEEDLVIIREKSVIAQVLRKYKNPSFNLKSPLNVRFQSSGRLELGVDAGGPTRAYFNLLMEELVRGSFMGIKLFEGEAGHLIPVFDYDIVSSGVFLIVGKMIAHSFIHECKGLAGIAPAIVSYIISGSRDTVLEHLAVDDIPDPCLREQLSKLLNCSDDDLCKFTSEGDLDIGQNLVAAGFPHIEVTPSNRSLAYECVLIYEVVTKRIPVLDDLRKGLDAVRVMATTVIDLAQQHHEVQQYIFPGATSKIKVAELRQQFKYETPTDDKTAKAAEHFEKYLDELYVRAGVSQEEETLTGLLLFWTAWPHLPMLEERMKVAFLPNQSSKVLAESDTCFKVLKIPTCHTDYNDFRTNMDISIAHGKVGFGKM